MRILLVYDCVFPENVGGVERRNRELGRVLAGRGHAVTLAGLTDGPRRQEEGVEILPLGPRPRLYDARGRRRAGEALRFAAAVARLDPRPFDVVETANIPYAHLFPLAARCRAAGRPLIVTWYELWGRYWRRYKGPIAGTAYAAVERAAVALGTAVGASSALTGDRLRARGRRPVAALPCGVDTAAIRHAVAAVERGSAPPLVYAGRLVREKRLDLLVEAVARLPGDDALLTIVGDGPDRERLRALTGRLDADRRVRFAGRLGALEEVWRALAAARVAVQPSSREGFGIFPLEAMTCGLPVVHCRSSESAVGELVRDGVEGLAVEPDPRPLADALARLLSPAGERERMAAAALRRADEYDWRQLAGHFEEIAERARRRVARRRS